MSFEYDVTTGLQVITKQPWEAILVDMDLSERMRPGDSISVVNSVSFVNQGKIAASTDIVIGSSSSNAAIVQVRVSAGQDLEDYKLTFRCTTASGDKIEGDGIVRVRD